MQVTMKEEMKEFLYYRKATIFITQPAKTFCLPYYACLFSSTKLVIKAEQDLPGTDRRSGERLREGGRVEK
jgi:hypothetical protein